MREFVIEVARKVNVHLVGFSGLMDDGKIITTEPWFEEDETTQP